MLPWFSDGRYPLFLAPMAGFTDMPFRQLCKEQGADVLVSEFVQAAAFTRDRERAWETVDFAPAQRPMGIQIFGSDPASMAEAARLIADRLAPDFVDLNFGCPADRVTDCHAGSSLLRDPARLRQIASAVVNAIPGTPVTAKMRTGWDAQSIVAVDVARTLEDVGIRALTVHGRTREQGYSGLPDWDIINAVARAVRVPVVGNGNIRTAADVLRLRAESPVRGLMIGRAALGYPWLFREIKAVLATGQPIPPPTVEERWAALLRYAHLLPTRSGTLNWARAKLKSFTHGMPQSRKLRGELDHVSTLADLEALASRWLGTPSP